MRRRWRRWKRYGGYGRARKRSGYRRQWKPRAKYPRKRYRKPGIGSRASRRVSRGLTKFAGGITAGAGYAVGRGIRGLYDGLRRRAG